MFRLAENEIEREAYLDAICVLEQIQKDMLHLQP
jgi:hypothetical protein